VRVGCEEGLQYVRADLAGALEGCLVVQQGTIEERGIYADDSDFADVWSRHGCRTASWEVWWKTVVSCYEGEDLKT
jgi:hypothetical protein